MKNILSLCAICMLLLGSVDLAAQTAVQSKKSKSSIMQAQTSNQKAGSKARSANTGVPVDGVVSLRGDMYQFDLSDRDEVIVELLDRSRNVVSAIVFTNSTDRAKRKGHYDGVAKVAHLYYPMERLQTFAMLLDSGKRIQIDYIVEDMEFTVKTLATGSGSSANSRINAGAIRRGN